MYHTIQCAVLYWYLWLHLLLFSSTNWICSHGVISSHWRVRLCIQLLELSSRTIKYMLVDYSILASGSRDGAMSWKQYASVLSAVLYWISHCMIFSIFTTLLCCPWYLPARTEHPRAPGKVEGRKCHKQETQACSSWHSPLCSLAWHTQSWQKQ